MVKEEYMMKATLLMHSKEHPRDAVRQPSFGHHHVGHVAGHPSLGQAPAGNAVGRAALVLVQDAVRNFGQPPPSSGFPLVRLAHGRHSVGKWAGLKKMMSGKVAKVKAKVKKEGLKGLAKRAGGAMKRTAKRGGRAVKSAAGRVKRWASITSRAAPWLAGLAGLAGLGLLLKKAYGFFGSDSDSDSDSGQTSVGHVYDGGAVGHDHDGEAVGRAANAARVLVMDAVSCKGHLHHAKRLLSSSSSSTTFAQFNLRAGSAATRLQHSPSGGSRRARTPASTSIRPSPPLPSRCCDDRSLFHHLDSGLQVPFEVKEDFVRRAILLMHAHPMVSKLEDGSFF